MCMYPGVRAIRVGTPAIRKRGRQVSALRKEEGDAATVKRTTSLQSAKGPLDRATIGFVCTPAHIHTPPVSILARGLRSHQRNAGGMRVLGAGRHDLQIFEKKRMVTLPCPGVALRMPSPSFRRGGAVSKQVTGGASGVLRRHSDAGIQCSKQKNHMYKFSMMMSHLCRFDGYLDQSCRSKLSISINIDIISPSCRNGLALSLPFFLFALTPLSFPKDRGPIHRPRHQGSQHHNTSP